MVWINLSQSEIAAVQELEKISDRAAAIVGAVLVESRIENFLKFYLADHKKNSEPSMHEDMFRFSGALGPFSAKINLGYMIGLYSSGVWDDLHYIRKIRNKFAHDLEIQDFKSQAINDLCNNIVWFKQFIFQRGTKEDETQKGLNFKMYEDNLSEKLEDPRSRYLLAIRFYHSSLHLPLPIVGEQKKKPLCTPRL